MLFLPTLIKQTETQISHAEMKENRQKARKLNFSEKLDFQHLNSRISMHVWEFVHGVF